MTATILVTGGAGYVGSHTCKALATHGLRPVVYDNLSRGHREFVKWGPLEEGDVLDRARLVEVLRRHQPEVVLHFAALAYVGESFAEPLDYYGLNVGGPVQLVAAMREAGCSRIVFSSSCATYGVPQRVPIVEGDPQLPISPYGASKLFAERVLADAGQAHALQWMALRYFNAAGADAGLEVGEWHTPEPHVLPRLLRSALVTREPFEVLGDDYATADGTAVRDYVHVEDLADAHVRAVQHLRRGGASGAVNLGSQSGTSVFGLIEAVRQIAGRDVPYRIAPRRAGDPPAAVADSALARQLLGWTPRYTDIRQTIESAARWHRHAPQTL